MVSENALRETGSQHLLAWVLRLVVTLEVLVYFGAALLHLGVRIPLGAVVLAVPNAILPASLVETILGIAAGANLAILMRSVRPTTRITFFIHIFLLAGVSLGMLALGLRVGPPPSPDWTLHYVMLVGIAAVLGLLLLKSRARKPDAGFTIS